MRIFISHSSCDEDAVRLLINLLCNALQNLNKGDIFCTSVEGHGIPPGNDADDAIRNAIKEADLLIGLITPSAITSTYVLFELGGRWLIKKPMIPLLARGVEMQHLDGPLTRIQVKNCSQEAEVREFIEHVAKALSLPIASSAFYVQDIQQFVHAANATQQTEASSPSASSAVGDPDIHQFIEAANETQQTEAPSSPHPPQRHPAYELAPLTKQLLIEASTPAGPNAGQIRAGKTIAHTIITTDTSTRNIRNEDDEAISRFDNAIQELRTNELIVKSPSFISLRETNYALTQKGFQFGHILRQPIQPMHENERATMRHYYISFNPGLNPEIHRVDCHRFVATNQEYLGYFSSLAPAVEVAKERHPDAVGCSICSPECHTS